MTNAPVTVTPEKTVGAMMTTHLVTLKLDDTLRLADDMLNLTQVRHFPVLDGDKLVGVINQDDLLHASMAAFTIDHAARSVEPFYGVSKGGEHPLWSRAGSIPRPRSGFVSCGLAGPCGRFPSA